MITPHSRRVRRIAAACVTGALAGVLVLGSAPGWGVGTQLKDPTDPTATETTTDPPVDPTATETTTAPADPPGPTTTETTEPPPTQPAPAVVVVSVNASDVRFKPTYWSGVRSAQLQLTVHNGGSATQVNDVVYTLPAGVTGVGAGCSVAGNRQVSCRTGQVRPGADWSLRVTVTGTADAWRSAPLSGGVSATATIPDAPAAGARTASDQFAVLFPPGPPAPGLTLTARDVRLPAPTDGARPTAGLNVRLGNTGSSPAQGAIEVVTPLGIQVSSFPSQCQSHERVQARRERCVLGTVPAGGAHDLVFTLEAFGDLHPDEPLWGAVQGLLTPTGQDTATTQTSFQLVVTGDDPAAPATPSVAPSPSAGAAGAVRGPDRPGQVTMPVALGSGQISIMLVISAIVGAVSFAGVLLLMSLRRRMRDEPPAGRPAAG